MKRLILLSILFISASVYPQQYVDTNKVYGVTLTSVNNLNSIVTALSSHSKKITARIVFDEFIPASDYTSAVNAIDNVSFTMGEILDSYYMNQYSNEMYGSRVTEYLNAFEDKIDIWEIGNEVNGEWLGSIPSVIQKIRIAYDLVKLRNKKTAITLYYNKVCYENPQNEMFRWVNENLPNDTKLGLDYVWVSYYEDDCENYQPSWQNVFDSLRIIFPNSKLGIGECGTENSNKKAEYIQRYYSMNINTPGYVGGYFWWYYKEDCVPKTKPLWNTLNNSMSLVSGINQINNHAESFKLFQNYPNPFNPETNIRFQIPASGFVSLKIFDMSGREISTLIEKQIEKGEYNFHFSTENFKLGSGAYFYQLRSENFIETKKMVILK